MGGAHFALKIEIRAVVRACPGLGLEREMAVELAFFVALLLPSVLGGGGSSVPFVEHELLSSKLWNTDAANLFIVRESEWQAFAHLLYVAAAMLNLQQVPPSQLM